MNERKPDPQEFAELVKRHKALETQRTVAQTQLAGAQSRLEEAKKSAREQFGTDDLAGLRALLEKMRSENLEKRAAYQAQLDAIDAQLKSIDAAHKQAGAAPVKGGA